MNKIFKTLFMRSGIPIAASVVIGINSNLFTSNVVPINSIYSNKHFWLIVISAIILIIYQMYIASIDKNNSDNINEKLDIILANTTPKPTASEIINNSTDIFLEKKRANSSIQIDSKSNSVKLLMNNKFVKMIDELSTPDKYKLNRFLQSISFQNISELLSSRILHKVSDSDAYIFRISSDLRAVGFINKSKNEIIFANIQKRR